MVYYEMDFIIYLCRYTSKYCTYLHYLFVLKKTAISPFKRDNYVYKFR